jgi:hypothetical protein
LDESYYIIINIYIYIIIIFDVEKFYPSITKELLLKALKWSRKYVDISDEEIEIVMQSRRGMMFVDGKPWVKKGGSLLIKVWDTSTLLNVARLWGYFC